MALWKHGTPSTPPILAVRAKKLIGDVEVLPYCCWESLFSSHSAGAVKEKRATVSQATVRSAILKTE